MKKEMIEEIIQDIMDDETIAITSCYTKFGYPNRSCSQCDSDYICEKVKQEIDSEEEIYGEEKAERP